MEAKRLNAIANMPGQPGWRAKVQPPEPDETTVSTPPDEDLTQNILDRMRQMAPSPGPPAPNGPGVPAIGNRIAVYYARAAGFVVCVESPPEWDIVQRFQYNEAEALAVVRVCRALGIKVKDTTGELSDGELGKDNDRAAAPPRRGRPRGSKTKADLPEADLGFRDKFPYGTAD